jgi:probable FeS assembly SUF system protein SufT
MFFGIHLMIVSRNFNGLLIPSAMPIIVSAGTEVEIHQAKGGFATVLSKGNLVRVELKDFDAIGLSSVQQNQVTSNNDNKTTLDLVWEALKTCYDPEIPVSIVDLGLIYNCRILDNKAIIDMTLTAPTCGMGSILISDVKNKVLDISGVKEVEVIMVFDPPWTTDRMSESAKIELGLI